MASRERERRIGVERRRESRVRACAGRRRIETRGVVERERGIAFARTNTLLYRSHSHLTHAFTLHRAQSSHDEA